MNKTTRRSIPTALQAHKEERQHAIEMLQRLLAEMQATPDVPNWSAVGDMVATTTALREVSDRVFREGEYAAS